MKARDKMRIWQKSFYRDCWYFRIRSRILSRNFCVFSDFSDFSKLLELFEFELFVLANAFRLYPFPVMFSKLAKFASFLNLENWSAKSVMPFYRSQQFSWLIIDESSSDDVERNLLVWNQIEIFLCRPNNQ